MKPHPAAPVYHILPASELARCVTAGVYEPESLQAQGFIHCSGTPDQVLMVARAFFSEVSDRLLVLRLEAEKLGEKLVWEPAAPVGGKVASEANGGIFPHVYGPITLAAISAVGVLREAGGIPAWPSQWMTLP